MANHIQKMDEFYRPFSIRLSFSYNKQLHDHKVHELYFATEDGGHQRWSGGSRQMAAGNLFFFPSRMMHNGCGPEVGTCQGLVINFSSDVFSPDTPGDAEMLQVLAAMTTAAKDGQVLMPTKSSATVIQSLIEEIIDEMQQKRYGYVSRMKSLLMDLLCDILRSGKLNLTKNVSRPVSTEERIWEVCRFLKRNHDLPSSVDEMATMANMSRSYFHAQFKAVTKHPFKEYLNELRAKTALNLLETTDLSLEQVANQSGFGSVSNFYLVFRKHVGTPPRQIQRPEG